MHACFVFWILLEPLVSSSVSRDLLGRFVVLSLQGTVASIGVSNFFLAFFSGFLELSIIQRDQKMPLSFRALSSFGSSIVHWCFSCFWPAFNMPDHISSNKPSGLVVAWICVSRLPDQKIGFGGLHTSVNFVNPVHESNKFRSTSTFQ